MWGEGGKPERGEGERGKLGMGGAQKTKTVVHR